eukprot:403367374
MESLPHNPLISSQEEQIDTQISKISFEELGFDYFKELISTYIEDVLRTDDEWLHERLENSQDIISDQLDSGLLTEINHVTVFQQNRGGLCGFHAYHNSKCFIRAILAKDSKSRLTNVLSSQIITKYWTDYERNLNILLNCTNVFYVHNTDKKSLKEECSPLERNHLRYLLMKDEQIVDLIQNDSGVEIFMHPFLYAFGLFQHNTEQIKEIETSIKRFRSNENEAIFTFFIGAVNHWVSMVIHKPRGSNQTPKFYLLDSSNLEFLNKSDEQLPEVMEKRSREKNKIGMKPSSFFNMKMSIHSLFDLKKAFEIIVDLFIGTSTIAQYYGACYTTNILKQFHSFTESFNPNTDELEIPKSRIFSQSKNLSAEEEASMSKYDLSEFLFPYKKVKGIYKYLEDLNTEDELLSLFDLISTFLLAGSRPQHIEADLNRNLHAFGKEGFFESDLAALTNWSECLLKSDDKFMRVIGKAKLLEQKGAESVRVYDQLIKVARELNKKLIKPSFLSRFVQ